MRIALAQMKNEGNMKKNHAKSLKYIKQAAENKANLIITVPNIYLEKDGKAYDASLFINENGEIQGIQKMVHIAQAKQFYEQDYYAPSDDGFQVFDTSFGRIGIVVCFDRH